MKFLNSTIALLFVALLWSCGSKTDGGDTAEGDTKMDETPKTTFENGTYSIATGTKLMWEGSKVVAGSHNGDVNVKSGAFSIEEDKITGGSIVVDMTTINNLDLADDADSKGKLEGHLMSADFFETETYPEAKLTITGSELVEGTTHKIMGDFTLKGKTNPIEFTAEVTPAEGGANVKGDFTFDRSKWDVKFRSTQFPEFANIAADQVISDDITIKFDLTAKK